MMTTSSPFIPFKCKRLCIFSTATADKSMHVISVIPSLYNSSESFEFPLPNSNTYNDKNSISLPRKQDYYSESSFKQSKQSQKG